VSKIEKLNKNIEQVSMTLLTVLTRFFLPYSTNLLQWFRRERWRLWH